MKQKADIGLEFIKKINFKRRSGRNALRDGLTQIYDKKKVADLEMMAEHIKDGSKEFYAFKNQDIGISTVISEYYDADIVRRFCNYLYDHKEYIKGEVLDVGCESGYMTGFLAMYFPEVHITAIDRSENAVNIARERLEKWGITNVKLKVADIRDINEQYDTVISMRTLIENIASEEINYGVFQGGDFSYQFPKNKEVVQPYAQDLQRLLKDDANLICIERMPMSPLEYGWLSALNTVGCAYIPDTFKHINCKEADRTGYFTAFVAQNRTSLADDVIWRAVTVDFLNANDEDSGWINKTAAKGWTALAYFLENKGERIAENYIIETDKIGKWAVGRFAAYYDKNDRTKMLFLIFINSYKNAGLDILDIGLKDRAVDEIEMRTQLQEQSGFTRSSEYPIKSDK